MGKHFRTDTDEVYRDGALVSSTVRQTDVTADAVEYDLHDRLRNWLTANRTYLALAKPTGVQQTQQIERLTREVNALIRLVLRSDLLDDDTGD